MGQLEKDLVDLVVQVCAERCCLARQRSLQALGVLSLEDLRLLSEDHLSDKARESAKRFHVFTKF